MKGMEEIGKVRVDIVAVQEIRWQGKKELIKKDLSLFYSGHKERTGRYGTGFIMNAKMRKAFFLSSLLMTGCANCDYEENSEI